MFVGFLFPLLQISNERNKKRSLVGYVKCFSSNEKARELFKNNNAFNDIRSFVVTKKVS